MEVPLIDGVVVSVGEGNVRAGVAGHEEPNFRRPTAQLLADIGSSGAAGPAQLVDGHHQRAPWSRSWNEWEDAVVAAAFGALETQKKGAGVGWDATREAVDDALPQLLAGRLVLLARPSSVAVYEPDRICQLIFERY
jgi:hypothetical protein